MGKLRKLKKRRQQQGLQRVTAPGTAVEVPSADEATRAVELAFIMRLAAHACGAADRVLSAARTGRPSVMQTLAFMQDPAFAALAQAIEPSVASRLGFRQFRAPK
jgi:hypothetical protein